MAIDALDSRHPPNLFKLGVLLILFFYYSFKLWSINRHLQKEIFVSVGHPE